MDNVLVDDVASANSLPDDAEQIHKSANSPASGQHKSANSLKKDMYYDCYTPAISFAELDALEETEEALDSMRSMAGYFSQMAQNIFYRDEIEDKVSALQSLANEFAERIQNPPANKERWQPLTNAAIKLKDKVKATIATKPEPLKQSFTVWHNKDTNQYRWFAIYSNKYRDSDNPPEIISEASHKDFVKGVESGAYPYPELWLWHVKGSRCGQADWLSYTDEGFSLASGYFDDTKAHIAKSLIAYPGELLTSHGMPPSLIKRDTSDKSIIIQHATKEISPLPAKAAANKLTSFELLRKETEMIPDEKKEFLRAAGLSDDEITQIEGTVKEKAQQAEGLEFKEAEAELDPADIIKAIEVMITPIAERLNNLESQVKALSQTDEAKIKQVVGNTPKSSLEALAAKSIESLFSDATKVDGREKLARSGPKETVKEQQPGLFFQQWMQPAQVEDRNV